MSPSKRILGFELDAMAMDVLLKLRKTMIYPWSKHREKYFRSVGINR